MDPKNYPKSPFGEQEKGIPTGRDVEWEPLVDYRRNGVSENTVHGAVAWYSGGELGSKSPCVGRIKNSPEKMDWSWLE